VWLACCSSAGLDRLGDFNRGTMHEWDLDSDRQQYENVTLISIGTKLNGSSCLCLWLMLWFRKYSTPLPRLEHSVRLSFSVSFAFLVFWCGCFCRRWHRRRSRCYTRQRVYETGWNMKVITIWVCILCQDIGALPHLNRIFMTTTNRFAPKWDAGVAAAAAAATACIP